MADRPVLSAGHLSTAEIETIHDASLRILERDGIAVAHDGLRERLADEGASVDGNVVAVDRELVTEAIAAAPDSFTFRARNPDNDVVVGGDDPVFAPAYGASNVLTVDGERRTSKLADYERLMKLVQCEDVVACTGYTACEVNDCESEQKPYEMTSRSLLYTDKPVMGDVFGEDRAQASLDLAGIAHGDRDLAGHYVAGQITPVSPRRLSRQMSGGLLRYADAGQPLVFASVVMAGATGPATLAGAFALANAEVLFGITAAQLIQEGVPVVYGTPASNFDMHSTALASGSPEAALATAFTGQMADFYDLPSRGGGSLTDSKAVDDQCGSESALQMATAMAADIDFVLHAVGMLEAYAAVSPVKFVLDCERLRTLTHVQDGYEVTEETLALDLISGVDPGGDYLSERHTLEHAREAHFVPELADRGAYEEWERSGSQSARERGRERVRELLNEYERPPIDANVEADIEAYVAENCP